MEIILEETLAYVARKATSGGDLTSSIDTDPVLDKEEEDENKGLLESFQDFVFGVFKGIIKIFGFLLGAVLKLVGEFFSWSISTLFGWIIAGVQFIWNFNWNVTDQEIENNIKGMFNSLIALTADTVGTALGYFACGLIPGTGILVINEAAGAYALKELGKEAADEFFTRLGQIINLGVRGAFSTAAQLIYKNKLREVIQNILDESSFARWVGYNRKEPFSFATAYENLLEKIPGEELRTATENLFDGFFDGCEEAFYVLGTGLDEYLMMLRNKESFEGTTYYYELEVPDSALA